MEKTSKNVNLKKLIGAGLGIVILIVSLCLPSIGDFSSVGIRTIGVLVAFILMLVCESLPIIVICLLFIGLLPLLGVTKNLQVALSGFSQPVVFFTLASFGLTAAFTTTPLAKRVLRALLRAFGKNINLVLLTIMICAALISSTISNVPACAVFAAIASKFLDLYDNPEDKKRTAKAFMIAIPVAAMIGGMITPAGSSINLIAIGLLEEFNGTTITFVQWMLAGFPLALVMLPLSWFIITRIHKPAYVSEEKIKDFASKMDIPEKMERREIYTIIISGTMFILWILSSWFPFFNVMVIAILGCALLMFPKIEVISVDTFLKENSWDAFFLVGTVLSLGAAMNANGVMTAIINLLPEFNVHIILFLGIVALLIFVALLILPVATSLISIIAVPLMSIAITSGISPALVILTASLTCCNCYLLPLDTVPLITYGKGYYSIGDMFKCTILIQLAFVVLVSLWIPVVGLMFGLI